MWKAFLIFILFLVVHHYSVAQPPTPVDYKKVAEDAKKKADEFLNDPKVKAAMEQARKMSGLPKGKSSGDSLNKPGQMGMNPGLTKTRHTDSTIFALPSRKEKYLNSLPIRTFTRAELISYLHNLNAVLTELVRSRLGIDIKNVPDSSVTKTGTSIAFWINGETEKSALVGLKGAEINADNITLLNNIGGILTGCGLGVNAIPILQYALEKQPGNNMILNNIGQAYLQLGDDKKAEKYLLQCISSYTDYPDANLALAYIYKSRGNKSSAIIYAENSLRGAWSSGAQNLLEILKPDAKLMDYLRHRYKQPEYFNFHKYPLLPQCRDTKYTPILKPQYVAYKEMLNEEKKRYAILRKQEDELAKKAVAEKVETARKLNKLPYRPFGIFANAVTANLWVNEYHDRFDKFYAYKNEWLAQREKFTADYLAEINAINEQYKLKKEDVAERDGEGNDGSEYDELNAAICGVKETVRNRYLNLFADATEAYQQKAIHLYNGYFNDMAFWLYVGSIDDHQYKVEFYDLVLQFLQVLSDINTTHFYRPCTDIESGNGKASQLAVIDAPECYFPGKVELPLGAFILELSCESYKLELGEGLVGRLEYNRVSGDFTLAFGVGGEVPKVFYDGPGIKAGFRGEAKTMVYMTFDKQGTATDLGIMWETELKLQVNVSDVKYGAVYEEALTAGFGTGVQMRDGGQLKALIDNTFPVQPEDNQMDKKVPLYKNK